MTSVLQMSMFRIKENCNYGAMDWGYVTANIRQIQKNVILDIFIDYISSEYSKSGSKRCLFHRNVGSDCQKGWICKKACQLQMGQLAQIVKLASVFGLGSQLASPNRHQVIFYYLFLFLLHLRKSQFRRAICKKASQLAPKSQPAVYRKPVSLVHAPTGAAYIDRTLCLNDRQ